MPRLFTTIFFALFICYYALAQTKTIDSLKKVLPFLKGTARIDCLNELGFEYSNIPFNKSHYVQTDTALIYIKEAINETSKLNYAVGMGQALQNLGMVNEQRGNFLISEQYTVDAISILKITNRKPEYYRAIVNLGWCDYNEGKYKDALYNYHIAIPYYRQIKDSTHLAMLYRMTGHNYSQMGYEDSAFIFYQKNDEIKKTSDDLYGTIYSPGFKADIYLAAGDTAMAIQFYLESIDSANAKNPVINHDYTSISTIYELKRQYDSAVFYFNKNIDLIKLRKGDSSINNISLMNAYLAGCDLYFNLNKYDKVIDYCQKVIKKFKGQSFINGLMYALDFSANAYLRKHENTNAFLYVTELLAYAQKCNQRHYIDDAYFILWKIYDAQHKPLLAYNYFLKYHNLNDSIESNNYKAKLIAWDAITKMNIKESDYENQIKTTRERANMKVAVVSKQEQLHLYIFISAIVIISLMVLLFTRNSKLNRRKEQLQFQANEAKGQLEVAALKQQTAELEMQALRSQMNPHFIFNCLSSINRFILKNKTEEASDYLTKFSRLIRMVLNNSKHSYISMEDELETLRLYLEMERLRFKNSFDYSFIYNNSVDANKIFIPPLLLQPFAENAIWHGLMHLPAPQLGKQEKGLLSFEFGSEEKILTCIITDNGVGRPQAGLLKSKSAEKQKSLGLKITKERLNLLNNTANEQTFFTIEDLVDENGNAMGTRVHLKIFYKELTEV